MALMFIRGTLPGEEVVGYLYQRWELGLKIDFLARF